MKTPAWLAVFLVFLAGCGSSENKDIKRLTEIHQQMDPGSIKELQDIAVNHPDEKVRERAVLVMTDIALKNDTADEVEAFLKGLLKNERSTSVKSAIYSGLDLIKERSEFPVEVTVSVNDVVKKARPFKLQIKVTARKNVHVKVSTSGAFNLETRGPASEVVLTTLAPFEADVQQGGSVTAEYEVMIKREGRYVLEILVVVSEGDVFPWKIEKHVGFFVRRSGGTYAVY